MSKKSSHPPIIRLYAKVGTPELLFFISLLALFFVPFILNMEGGLISYFFYSIFILSLYFLIYKETNKRMQRYFGIFLLFALGVFWLQFFGVSLSMYLEYAIQIVIMSISFYYIFKNIFTSANINLNTLISAVSGYLLIGIAMGIVVFIFQIFNTDNFSFGKEIATHEAYYFSFVTMSTLGYGDVVPLSTTAKGLTILITLIGQFYMVIVMGIIVGKLVASRNNQSNE